MSSSCLKYVAGPFGPEDETQASPWPSGCKRCSEPPWNQAPLICFSASRTRPLISRLLAFALADSVPALAVSWGTPTHPVKPNSKGPFSETQLAGPWSQQA